MKPTSTAETAETAKKNLRTSPSWSRLCC